MRRCPDCGRENSDGTTLCDGCGSLVAALTIPEERGPAAATEAWLASSAMRLDEIALERGDPALFPPEVRALYRAGERRKAHAALRASPCTPAEQEARKPFLEDLRFWIEPCGAPSLVTVQGFGVDAYGRHQPRADGSYILTTYLVALFVPVIPLAAYVVHDAPNGKRGWYFVGQTPLSPEARLYGKAAAAVGGVALLALLLWP